MTKTLKEIFVKCVVFANKDMRDSIESLELILEAEYLIEEVQETSLAS